jgi:Nrap protein domain 1
LQETFVRADHQNQKYILKRALYLCYVAAKLQASALSDELEFGLLEGDPWKPTLIIKSAEKLSKHFQVRIFCAPEVESFKLAQLGPEKANIKFKWATGQDDDGIFYPNFQMNAIFTGL